MLVKRIARTYRLRILFGLHLALYGTLLASCAIVPSQTVALLLLLWLPLILGHTAAHSLHELRERSAAYVPVPVTSFNPPRYPVIIYDEDGRRVPDDEHIDCLPG